MAKIKIYKNSGQKYSSVYINGSYTGGVNVYKTVNLNELFFSLIQYKAMELKIGNYAILANSRKIKTFIKHY